MIKCNPFLLPTIKIFLFIYTNSWAIMQEEWTQFKTQFKTSGINNFISVKIYVMWIS